MEAKENENFPLKWCLQRVFNNIDVVLVSEDYKTPILSDKFTLYYSRTKEAYINTIEECISLPFHLCDILINITKNTRE